MDSDSAFSALADPVRRQILGILAEHDECNAGDLAEKVDQVGRTAVSGHLRILRTAGLIVERKEGRYRYYSVDPSGPARDVIGLLQNVFQSSLEDVKRAAESPPGRRQAGASEAV